MRVLASNNNRYIVIFRGCKCDMICSAVQCTDGLQQTFRVFRLFNLQAIELVLNSGGWRGQHCGLLLENKAYSFRLRLTWLSGCLVCTIVADHKIG